MKKKTRIAQAQALMAQAINESSKPDRSPIIPQRSKFKGLLKIYQRDDLTEKQKQFLNLAADKEVKMIFVSGPAGTSKAQPLDADILGKDGWIKMGNISVGDEIFGENGHLYKVISIHPQGIKDIYKVSFSDGTSTECTSEHLWKTQTSKDRNIRKWTKTIDGKRHREWAPPLEGSVKTTSEIADTLYVRNGDRVNHSIPLSSPINFGWKPCIISPYIMGVLLGDGCFRHKGYVSFSSGDKEIIDRVSKEIPNGMEVHHLSRYDYSIVHKNRKDSRGGNCIKNEIKRLNLDYLLSNKKHIPSEYLFNSIENRIELLRGLLDTDGHIDRRTSSVYFTTTSNDLMLGVRFLVESVGGVCHVILRHNSFMYLDEKKKGLDSYSMCICMPPEINPFFLSRKHIVVVPKIKYKPVRYIINVEKVGQKECQCILVNNPSHLYLTNNFIVTHNTFLAVFHALKMINEKRVSDLVYIRSAVESSDAKLGFLPGEANEKMAPYLQPLLDKMAEMLPKSDVDVLMKEERVSSVPVGFLRGLNWNAKVIIADEAQNLSFKELFTLITRTGEFSKVFILGDPEQSDINGKSGFIKMISHFDDEESRQNGIHVFRFTEDDIVRSGLVRFIIKHVKKAL